METTGEADAELVRQAQAGNSPAFDQLVERYQEPVYHFIYRMLSGHPDALDLAQDTFVRAYRNLAGYRPRPNAAFSTWLFQIARNAALDHRRRQARRPVDPIEEAHGQLAARTADASAQLSNQEMGTAIAHAIAQLPEDQRTALVLSIYHESSAAEIASVMKTSVRAVESHIFRARQRLRNLLGHLR